MKQFIKSILAICCFFYVFFSFVIFVQALMFESGELNEYNRCYYKPTRIKTLFPSFKLGCYLGAEIDQPYYDYNSLKEYNKTQYNPYE